MPAQVLAAIRSARARLREEENRTHEAAIELRNCKEREKKAKVELDRLLDELETGVPTQPQPGLDRPEAADPTPSAAEADDNGQRHVDARKQPLAILMKLSQYVRRCRRAAPCWPAAGGRARAITDRLARAARATYRSIHV